MFISRRVIYLICLALILGACSNRNPLITEELESVTIQCMDSDELMEITDEKMLKKVLKEINNSRREGTEEMEFLEGHDVTLETVSGETHGTSLFDGGKLLIMGFYIHSDIPNFCDK